jgi:hypothetical protein
MTNDDMQGATMTYLDEIPTEKELAHLLREARRYVSDAGCDEDPETQRHSIALLAKIDAALERTVIGNPFSR